MRLLFIFFVFCSSSAFAAEKLTVMTNSQFPVDSTQLQQFQQDNDVTVDFVSAGEHGERFLCRLTEQKEEIDVVYGIDNTFFSQAIESGIFIPYNSPLLSQIPESLQFDSQDRLLPVDFRDVCLNYDTVWFTIHNLPPPTSLEDLLLPEYRGLTVMEDPVTSATGFAFLLATIGHFGDGDDGFLNYWSRLKENDVLIVENWSQAYYQHFSAAINGGRPIIVSYATGPAATVYASEDHATPSQVQIVNSTYSAYRHIHFAGILKDSSHKKLARKFVDFILDTPFQEELPLKIAVLPANINAKIPDVFLHHKSISEEPVSIHPEVIRENQEVWLSSWKKTIQ